MFVLFWHLYGGVSNITYVNSTIFWIVPAQIIVVRIYVNSTIKELYQQNRAGTILSVGPFCRGCESQKVSSVMTRSSPSSLEFNIEERLSQKWSWWSPSGGRYVLHLDIWGSVHSFANIVHFFTVSYLRVLGFLLAPGRYIVGIMAKPAHSLTSFRPDV